MSDKSSIQWCDATWNPVPGFSLYEVSDSGEIRNRNTGRALKPMRAFSGHLYILARVNGRGKKLFVHRAVLLAFVGAPQDGQEARHLNDRQSDNRLSNLAWGTRLENVDDKRRNDRLPTGERSGTAKLTETQVRDIRERVRSGSTLRALASEYGVSHTAIRRASNGMKWGHLT